MHYDLAIFDMDGTILDTLDDLTDTLNHALRVCSFPARTRAEVEGFVGDGICKLVERGLPTGAGEEAQRRVHGEFVDYYRVHRADHTHPYPGIVELVEDLRNAGIRTAVVSNKDDDAVKALCVRFFPGLIDCAIGHREGLRRKPAPDTVNEALEKLAIPRGRAVYIGDTEVDLSTAKNAEMDCIACAWGFRGHGLLEEDGARLIVDAPEEVLHIVLSQ